MQKCWTFHKKLLGACWHLSIQLSHGSHSHQTFILFTHSAAFVPVCWLCLITTCGVNTQCHAVTQCTGTLTVVVCSRSLYVCTCTPTVTQYSVSLGWTQLRYLTDMSTFDMKEETKCCHALRHYKLVIIWAKLIFWYHSWYRRSFWLKITTVYWTINVHFISIIVPVQLLTTHHF